MVKMIHCLERHYVKQLSQNVLIDCLLCNKKLKSKSGYTLHLKKCSRNVHFSQPNKAETISPTTTAPPLPTPLATIISPTTDTMTTSPTALTTVLKFSKTAPAKNGFMTIR